MFRTLATSLLALSGLAALATGAFASDPYGSNDDGFTRIWKPYVIEKNCTGDWYYHCRARMDYAPFQRSMVARPGSYWYQKPFQVYRYGDFTPRRSYGRHSAAHVAWCSDHYRTYDPATNRFKGRGYQLYTCHSPYGG